MFSKPISNTRKSVSSDIQTLQSWLNNSAVDRFFNTLRSVWIADGTLFLLFDVLLHLLFPSPTTDNRVWRGTRSPHRIFSFYVSFCTSVYTINVILCWFRSVTTYDLLEVRRINYEVPFNFFTSLLRCKANRFLLVMRLFTEHIKLW